jgi:hypothetical protein
MIAELLAKRKLLSMMPVCPYLIQHEKTELTPQQRLAVLSVHTPGPA